MSETVPARGTDEWRAWAKGEVFRLMAEEGLSLRRACQEPNMPSKPTVLGWVKDDAAFADQYARAREALLDHWADETIEISDDSSQDTKWVGRDGAQQPTADAEWIARSRLRVDTRKWLLSKLAPKVYGDKVQVGGTGPNGEIAHEVAVKVSFE